MASVKKKTTTTDAGWQIWFEPLKTPLPDYVTANVYCRTPINH